MTEIRQYLQHLAIGYGKTHQDVNPFIEMYTISLKLLINNSLEENWYTT